MNFKIFFFLIVIILSSNSFAQWLVNGGNVSWPYGNMYVKGKTKLNGNLFKNGDDFAYSFFGGYPSTQNLIYANQESWWGALSVVNYWGKDYKGEILMPDSRLMGMDIKALSTGDSLLSPHGLLVQSHLGGDSGAVWKGNVKDIIGINVTATVGNYIPKGVDPNWSFMTLFHAAVDEINTTFVDTLGYTSLYGYEFRFGNGNKKRYKETRSFFSDLTSYSAATKILNGKAYHFYGQGDYPSYFGGAIIQKVYTYDVHDPPSTADLESFFGPAEQAGAGFNVFINDNDESANFYHIVSDGSIWWVFTASQAP